MLPNEEPTPTHTNPPPPMQQYGLHTHIHTPESDRASKSNYQFLGSLTPRGRCQQNPNIRNSTGQLTQVHQKIFPRAKARQKWGITYRLKET